MTNQSSDTQPALRARNTLVRGGRLTKFKGRVASIAPGLSVVTTAAVLFSGSAAQAACTVTGGAATCPAVTYDSGIVYSEADAVHTLTLQDDPSLTVRGNGVTVDYGGDQNVSVQMGRGTVETTGFQNHGVSANTTGTGNVEAGLNGDGDITVNGDSSSGLRARIGNGDSTAEATAVMTAGEITIESGTYAEGVSAATMSRQGGDVTARMEGGEITTSGDQVGAAVHAYAHEATYVGTLRAVMTGGVISTENTNADEQSGGVGVRASTRSSSEHTSVIAQMEGGTITTNGSRSHAVTAEAEQSARDSQANMTARMTGGTITTMRHNSAGVRAHTHGFGDARVEMDETNGRSSITTHGNQAHGLQAFSTFEADRNTVDSATVAGNVTAIMGGGTITTHDDFAHGAHVLAGTGQAKALIEMHDGGITTNAAGAHGLYARIDSPGNDEEVRVEMTGGSIRTENDGGSFFGSHGILADTNGSADVVVDVSVGEDAVTTEVTTIGRNSHGIWAVAEGVGAVQSDAQVRAKTTVNLGQNATVTASGHGSDGIRVSGLWVDPDDLANRVLLGVEEFDIDVAGSVTGGADQLNPGIAGQSDGAAIRVVSAADGDGGTIDIASTGRVVAGDSGLAILEGLGDAVVTVAGHIDGEVFLGAGDDSLTIGATASFDFSHALDGGRGDDHLILHGRTMTSMENVINWEHLTLNDTELRLEGIGTLETALDIEAGSVFHATGREGGTTAGAPTADGMANASGGGLTIAGDVTNAGAVTLSVQDGAAGDVITIDGDYTGSGSSLFALDAVIAGNDAGSDRLVITGDASGEMMLSIAGLDSTAPEGGPLAIYVVSVGGEADGATFTLMEGNHVMSDGEHG
ncbi:hypothetical protein SLH47_26175, partial [Cognatiyoonia sp. IB215182]|nr:hypothetical protein [Cognatiyoonia sp. IB215182]